MMRFKAGDRVIVVDGSGRLKNGYTGTVTGRFDSNTLTVKIDDEWGMEQFASDGWFDRRFRLYEEDSLEGVQGDIGSLLFA